MTMKRTFLKLYDEDLFTKKMSWTAYFVLLRTFRAVGGVWACL